MCWTIRLKLEVEVKLPAIFLNLSLGELHTQKSCQRESRKEEEEKKEGNQHDGEREKEREQREGEGWRQGGGRGEMHLPKQTVSLLIPSSVRMRS